MSGKYAQAWYTGDPCRIRKDAEHGRAEPAIPNAKPKKRPETMPTLPGTSSCAYTTIAGNAEARIKPIAS